MTSERFLTASHPYPMPRSARIGLGARPLAALAALVALVVPAVAPAGPIAPGVDLFRTPGNGSSYHDFSTTPIPANFFGPGSDPFVGRIFFTGSPLSPASPLGPTDTVVQRNAGTTTVCNGSPVAIPIEIVALSLVSVNPITVTYNGGTTSEQWNVKVGLSSISPQPPGTMTIRQSGTNGGTFSSTLPVAPRVVFDRIGPAAQRVLDGVPAIQFSSQGYWVQSSPAELGICSSPGGVQVDHDANPGTSPRTIGPSGGPFVAGVVGLPMSCGGSPAGYGKTLTEEEAQLARHGVLPPQCIIPPQEGASFIGDKCMITTPGQAAAMGAVYLGNGTVCLGDLDDNGRDDALPPGVPGLPPRALGLAGALLLAAGAWFVARRRGAEGGA